MPTWVLPAPAGQAGCKTTYGVGRPNPQMDQQPLHQGMDRFRMALVALHIIEMLMDLPEGFDAYKRSHPNADEPL